MAIAKQAKKNCESVLTCKTSFKFLNFYEASNDTNQDARVRCWEVNQKVCKC